MNTYKLTLKEIYEASKGQSGQDQGILKVLQDQGAPVRDATDKKTGEPLGRLELDPAYMMSRNQEPSSLEIEFKISLIPTPAPKEPVDGTQEEAK